MTAGNLARPAVEHEPAAIPGEQPGHFNEAALSDFDLSQWRAELLDEDGWTEILSQYGRTMRLAVAMTDTHGNMLGPCHNPQPVWSLARRGAAGVAGACPFCLAPKTPCKAVADALATGEVVYVQDQAGLAHVAIPLCLGNQPLGALIAGQTLSQYPQPLLLQRVAKNLGASQQEFWNAAVHQAPVSHATLHLYADLLASLGQAFLRQRYASILDRKLHQTNERYRLMIEGSKDHALFTIDRNGKVTSWNPGAERLLGYMEAEIVGRNHSAFFAPEDVQSGMPAREIQLVERSGWIEREVWQIRKDGTRFLAKIVTARLGEGEALDSALAF